MQRFFEGDHPHFAEIPDKHGFSKLPEVFP